MTQQIIRKKTIERSRTRILGHGASFIQRLTRVIGERQPDAHKLDPETEWKRHQDIRSELLLIRDTLIALIRDMEDADASFETIKETVIESQKPTDEEPPVPDDFDDWILWVSFNLSKALRCCREHEGLWDVFRPGIHELATDMIRRVSNLKDNLGGGDIDDIDNPNAVSNGFLMWNDGTEVWSTSPNPFFDVGMGNRFIQGVKDPVLVQDAVNLRTLNEHVGGRFSEVFTATDTKTVNHGLGARPLVQVVHPSNDNIDVGVKHTDVNTLVLSFEGTLTSAEVICDTSGGGAIADAEFFGLMAADGWT